MMRYAYSHTATEATTGYFACEPDPPLPLERALAYLADNPLDDFMRRHILTRLSPLDAGQITLSLHSSFAATHSADLPDALRALVHELAALRPSLRKENPAFFGAAAHEPERAATSLIFLRWDALPDKELHVQWGRFFADNTHRHRALKSPAETGLPPLYPDALPGAGAAARAPDEMDAPPLPGLHPVFLRPFTVRLPELHRARALQHEAATLPYQRPPAAETAALAEQRLLQADIIAGKEMRHTASLSPIALLRPWHVRMRVKQKKHDFTLEGTGTTYGRGTALADARASCLMEMVERASAYLSVDEDQIVGRKDPSCLLYDTRTGIMERTGENALDPNCFPLEVPYRNEALYWIAGEDAQGTVVYVPVQMVSLFSNLEEISLYDSPGSTGLATGCTMEEARLAALLEIAERDAEAVTPFTKASCFTLRADAQTDPAVKTLLDGYAAHGINVQFQDLTGPLGIPVYKCFVMSPKGAIAAGHGAGLSARRAVISALTETPFPFPGGGPSGPALRKLPTRALHELPDYSLGHPAADLAMLEELLLANGRAPVYVNLTRHELAFPVVKALVPSLELAADRDAFSRVPLRLYTNYLELFPAP